ncbi:glucose-1-phosphate cytidylyltransferase [Polaribacter vadi]|uniref:Glucose-1-phosphate cytidylyltransferase n=1 Tax=Polaribacter vadi TaxID=1774273 RepID=A0A1B8U3W8_9FLAO|nr:glucose-1-phosphate cytidylyltransferase [Polaribacter vadi]AOW17540.1 glucose-1-phosphate cytidylyltransferase [Polaribacter vadi]OBY66573.1 glucose-1-phosphate cytidylyltransferase [Polaribacter vadi]
MKVVILAGGFGTRLSEETASIPKPMVKIGDKPIIWHIMKHYSSYGFNDFVILGGYKSYVIKEYFANYYLHQSDVEFDMTNNTMTTLDSKTEDWKVTVLDTGLHTMTGGRIKRAAKYLDEPFMLTYGDGVSNVNIGKLVDFHKSHSQKVTMTCVQPEGRFGAVDINVESNVINSFMEKPKGDGAWINGGFFVCDPIVFDYLENDATIFERSPLENIANDKLLAAYKHTGFWKPMDTLRDKNELESKWADNKAPWKTW